MRKFIAPFTALAVALLLAMPAWAQPSTFPAKVEQPWFPQGRLATPITATGSSSATLLPSAGFIGWLCNTGTADAWVGFGTANTVTTSATTGTYLKAGSCSSYDLFPAIGAAAGPYTYVATITGGTSTTITVETGMGQPPLNADTTVTGTISTTQGTSPWIVGLTPLTPVVAGSAVSSSVLKNAAGNLASVYAISTVSGYLMVFNATSAPSNGATTAGVASGNMVECIGPSTQPFAHFGVGPLEAYSVGITAVFSSTGCATLTLSATAFIHGAVQ